jgi:TPR repeat protein
MTPSVSHGKVLREEDEWITVGEVRGDESTDQIIQRLSDRDPLTPVILQLHQASIWPLNLLPTPIVGIILHYCVSTVQIGVEYERRGDWCRALHFYTDAMKYDSNAYATYRVGMCYLWGIGTNRLTFQLELPHDDAKHPSYPHCNESLGYMYVKQSMLLGSVQGAALHALCLHSKWGPGGIELAGRKYAEALVGKNPHWSHALTYDTILSSNPEMYIWNLSFDEARHAATQLAKRGCPFAQYLMGLYYCRRRSWVLATNLFLDSVHVKDSTDALHHSGSLVQLSMMTAYAHTYDESTRTRFTNTSSWWRQGDESNRDAIALHLRYLYAAANYGYGSRAAVIQVIAQSPNNIELRNTWTAHANHIAKHYQLMTRANPVTVSDIEPV